MKFGFRSTVKSLFNVKSWIGWDNLAYNGAWIRSMYGELLQPAKSNVVVESFEESCQRYGYTAEFLKNQEIQFEQASLVYMVLLVLGLLYTSWLFYQKKLLAFGVMLPLDLMLFAFYFRESFWLMQIRQKRLGMTFNDWVNIVVLKNGKA